MCSCSIVEMPELGSEHADDGVRAHAVGQMERPLEIERLPDHPPVAAKAFLPERIRQEDDALRAGGVFAFRERPAKEDARAEQFQIACGHRRDTDRGRPVTLKIEVEPGAASDGRERSILPLPFRQLRQRKTDSIASL